MYPVSAAYMAASRAQIREAQAHARIYMGMFDDTASHDATLTFPAKAKYSTPGNVNADAAVTTSYATFEPDRLRLDGKHQLLPEAAVNYAAQGFISAAQSGADGMFATPPEIVITFGVLHTLVGLTLTFDPVDPPPVQLTVSAYAGGALSGSTILTAITNPLQWELLLTDVDKLVLRIDKTAQPQGRARLNHIEFGIGYSFQDREIIELTEKHTDAPVSTTLPSSSLSFTLDNSDERYTLDGDTALVRFLAAGQQVSVIYGMDVSGGEEQIPGSIWRLDSWDIDGSKAVFNCTDAIAGLTKTQYEKGVYDWGNHTMYDQAVTVLADAGVAATDYYIDPHLKTIYSAAPIPIVSHAEALQLIANLARARLFVSRTGKVTLATLVLIPRFSLRPPSATTRYNYYSDINSVLQGNGVDYATYERDYFRLDGSMKLIPEGSAIIAGSGMTSKACSADGGSFAPEEMLVWVVYSDAPTNVYSVTLGFGGQIPACIAITATQDGVVTAPLYFYPIKNVETFCTNLQHCTNIQVTILQARSKAQRAHLSTFAMSNITDFMLDKCQIFDRSKGKMLTRLRSVAAQWIWRSYYPTVDSAVVSQKCKTNQGWMRIEHECCYAPNATTDNATVTVEQRNYAFVSYVRLTSATDIEVNLTITGKKLYEAPYPIQSAAHPTGEDLPIMNPLYDNTMTASVLDWIRDYYSRRVEYQSSCRGFPELDMADIITLEDGSTAQITASELTYNGAFRQQLTYRK